MSEEEMDLTRFDFQALRFMQSENVRKMTLEEIGQYVLLLCESWLGGKEASLSTDPIYLAQLVRGETVSPLVLKQFNVVQTQWGERLQNETLKGEWDKALERSEMGRKSVEIRWEKERNTFVLPKPSQAVPSQTSPDQEKDVGNFSIISIRYRAAMKKSHSKAKPYKENYQKACDKHGEQTVLDVFDEWAENNKWRADKLGNNGLRFFFIDLPELVEELRGAEALTEQREGPKVDMAAVKAEIERARAVGCSESLARFKETEQEESLENIPITGF